MYLYIYKYTYTCICVCQRKLTDFMYTVSIREIGRERMASPWRGIVDSVRPYTETGRVELGLAFQAFSAFYISPFVSLSLHEASASSASRAIVEGCE